ncbi:MAG: hypothetical protein B6I37_09495 [Desulfobacteraceae bacterium 4572_35.2]|nr:MAG: hypothetical protein B6I37_09495 [Desulfobacteraceae bacterium 4572_35.2]
MILIESVTIDHLIIFNRRLEDPSHGPCLIHNRANKTLNIEGIAFSRFPAEHLSLGHRRFTRPFYQQARDQR